jgi:hypothetical protein
VPFFTIRETTELKFEKRWWMERYKYILKLQNIERGHDEFYV